MNCSEIKEKNTCIISLVFEWERDHFVNTTKSLGFGCVSLDPNKALFSPFGPP